MTVLLSLYTTITLQICFVFFCTTEAQKVTVANENNIRTWKGERTLFLDQAIDPDEPYSIIAVRQILSNHVKP